MYSVLSNWIAAGFQYSPLSCLIPRAILKTSGTVFPCTDEPPSWCDDMYFKCISSDVSTTWTILPCDLLYMYVAPAILFWSTKATEEATLLPVLDIIACGYFSWQIMLHTWRNCLFIVTSELSLVSGYGLKNTGIKHPYLMLPTWQKPKLLITYA